ncbi:MAG TPA: LPS assembly protein LptD, partial [Roseiflexaceae bacterium]|nr:LPS assembly protein LptD [Roseiflexaceae bacterium]
HDGSDSLKFSSKVGYTLPRVGGLGDIWAFTATMQGDFYDVKNAVDADNPGRTFTGSVVRLFPQVSLDWRWPWVRKIGQRSYQLIEPIINLVLAPRLNRQWKIPNEDAIDQIFDETNLFSANRYTGTDRLEGGQRINYGVRLGLYGANGGSSTLFLGQSYRFNADSSFPDGSALRYRVSDTISALSIAPSSKWDIFARTRFSNENLRLRQADLIGRVGSPAFNVQLSYVYIDDNLSGSNALGDRQELNLNVSSRISEFWTIGGLFSHDLEARKTRLYGARLKYEDECFVFAIDAQRRLYRDRFVEPDTRVLVRILFKQFTGVGATVY